MATTSLRPTATRTIAIGLLLITVCAALWLVMVGTDEHQRTVVRITQPVAAGEYLTGVDIEAVQITVGSNAQDYVTTGQAGSGLIAAHDLAVGDVLLVSSVYATGQQPAPSVPSRTTSSNVGALDLLAITAGIVGILGVVVWVARRRRPSPHPSRPGTASVPTNRAPGWLHVEVNTWIKDDGDWDQRARARPRAEVANAAAGQADRRTITIPRDADFVLTPGSVKVDSREGHDTESQGDNEGPADALEADQNTAPEQTATTLDEPPAGSTPDQSDSAEAALFEVFKPTSAEKDSSTQHESPEPATTDESSPGWGQPFALLQVFGDVKVHGVPVSQAAAAPFILAAAGRPMSTDELVELTGYAAKTFSSVYPASHPIVTRTNGMLTLAPGVWTDHSWLAETVRRAASAVRYEPHAEAAGWLRQAFDLAGRIDGAPFERVPRSRREVIHGRRRDPWAWVDEFPYTMDARTHAGQEAVEAALAAAALWQAVKPIDTLPSTGVVDVLCKLARLLPDVPVSRTVRPTRWQTGAPCLLLAALEVADSRELTGQVQATAQRLVADQIIEADPDLADDLGM